MCLYADLIERSGPFTNCFIRILTEKKIDLFEGTSVGLDTIEASHIYYGRSHFLELVHSGNILSGRLPHIPIYEGKLYFMTHKFSFLGSELMNSEV